MKLALIKAMSFLLAALQLFTATDSYSRRTQNESAMKQTRSISEPVSEVSGKETSETSESDHIETSVDGASDMVKSADDKIAESDVIPSVILEARSADAGSAEESIVPITNPMESASDTEPVRETENTSSSSLTQSGTSAVKIEETRFEEPEHVKSVASLSSETDYSEEEDQIQTHGLTDTQRNSVNMLNYMTVLTQKINESKGDQLFLESAYSSLVNDIYPNAVDPKTQAQITSLMDTVDSYRMIAVKRDRLEYIYEQNRAQALRQAIPNPIGLLSAVQSGSILKAAASALYMAVDSISSYSAAASQADLQFIKEGWELNDAESAELHNSTKNALSYMLNMVRDYDLPGDYALTAEAVQDFVTWSSKPDSQLVHKIAWFEAHKNDYQEFGSYWLEMARDYYNSDNYEKCLFAIAQYEAISTRIFRKDIDYANVLPMAIVSAKETMSKEDYIKTAEKYCEIILMNIKDADWSLRYFVAQIYMDICSLKNNNSYLESAYEAAFNNVVVLVEEQKKLNSAYLADVQEIKANKDATKREEKEIKEYNKILKKERKIALPPVNEALYLNCDLLFALVEEMDQPVSTKNQIDAILHENGDNLFLTQALDDRFWFGKETVSINPDELDISFDGEKLTLPASCITDRSLIIVTVNGKVEHKDWIVKKVKRPKGANCSEFIVYFESKSGKEYKYQAGDKISIKVIPVSDASDKYMEFSYNVVPREVPVFQQFGIKFERVFK